MDTKRRPNSIDCQESCIDENVHDRHEDLDTILATVSCRDRSECNFPPAHITMASSESEQSCQDAVQSSDTSVMDAKLRPIRAYLNFLLEKADEYQAHLILRRDHQQMENLCRVLPTFLKTCHPFFSYLEHTGRSCLPHRPPLPTYIRTWLLDFSEQLCRRLEELILTYASYNFLSLEETDPLSISHFFIGHCQVEELHVSIFRFCCPSPFHPGPAPTPQPHLYKLMRWNVERPTVRRTETTLELGEQEAGRAEGDRRGNTTEYYFLCCEEVRQEVEEQEVGKQFEREGESKSHAEEAESSGGGEREGQGSAPRKKMWSIGQWVQTHPDPHSDDIYDWILCNVPRGQYQHLFHLGTTEPSTSCATDCLLRVLLSQRDQPECATRSSPNSTA